SDRDWSSDVCSSDLDRFAFDEVGEMPLALQAKLLRALQEKEIVPLGEGKPISVDVRIVAATNRDLEEMVEQHRFREDLLYRLDEIGRASCRERVELR